MSIEMQKRVSEVIALAQSAPTLVWQTRQEMEKYLAEHFILKNPDPECALCFEETKSQTCHRPVTHGFKSVPRLLTLNSLVGLALEKLALAEEEKL